MNRTRAVIAAALLALVAAISMFAPTPVTTTVEANQQASCKGLQNAYSNCMSNPGNGNTCSAIREQLLAHGCYYGSSGGPATSGSGSY